MSQENVRRLYEAWNRGDLGAALDLMHPDIKIDYSAGVFPGIDELYEGREGAAAYWEDLHSPWKSLSIDVERLEAVGNKVVTVFTYEGEGREGIVVRRRLANVLTITDGLVERLDAYDDPQAALEAAGLA